MKPLAAVFHLFASAIFLVAGVLLMGLFLFEPARLKLLHLVETEPDLFVVAGSAGVVLGVLFVFAFYIAHRGKFLVLKMGERTVALDAKVITHTLHPFFQKQFGRRLSLLSVEIGAKGHLEISIRFAPQVDAEQILTLLEGQLQTLFAERFGYKKPFKMVVAET